MLKITLSKKIIGILLCVALMISLATVNAMALETADAVKPATVTFNGAITFVGGDLAEQRFAINLYQTDYDFGIDEDALAVQKTEVNGKFSFTQEFYKTGMYFFAIAQDVTDLIEGVAYDNAVHCYAVRISDNDGQLRAAVMNVDNGEVSEPAESTSVLVAFTNETFNRVIVRGELGSYSAIAVANEIPEEPEAVVYRSIPGSPQTGDNANLFVWLVLMFVSGGVIAFVLFGKLRKDVEEG